MSTEETDAVSILVVEDYDPVRKLIGNMLEPTRHRIIVCRDGQEALDVFLANPSIELVVTDVTLPDLSGPDLVRRLREIAPGLQALLISGGQDVGNDLPFLSKPFTATELRSKVVELLATLGSSMRPTRPT